MAEGSPVGGHGQAHHTKTWTEVIRLDCLVLDLTEIHPSDSKAWSGTLRNAGVAPSPWREHPSYCRTTGIMGPLGSLSPVGLCGPYHSISPHHIAQHWAYLTSNTLIWPFDVRWLGTFGVQLVIVSNFGRNWLSFTLSYSLEKLM